MAVFLSVLKIIGIVLLCILGFVLLMLLLILFVPWRYAAEADTGGGFSGKAKLHWLLHFLSAEFSFGKEINLRIKLLGIPFYDKKRKEEKAKKKEEKRRLKEEKRREKEKQKRKKDKKPEEAEEKEESRKEEIRTEEIKSEEIKPEGPAAGSGETTQEAGTARDEKESGEETSEEIPDGKKAEKKKGFFQKLADLWEQFTDVLWKLPEWIEEGEDAVYEHLDAAVEKIDGILNTIDYYVRLLGSEGTEWVVEFLKKRVIGVLKAIRPTRLDADVEVVDDDPGNVAKIYQYQAFALPVLERIPGNVTVDAWQGEKEFHLKARLKGRVLLWALAWHGLLLILNKKVKHFVRALKRET